MTVASKNAMTKINWLKLWALTIIASTLFMSACSKIGSEASVNFNTPIEQYLPIKQLDVMNYLGDFIFVYYGLCNCPVNYVEIAEHTSPSYINAKDAFEKKDILDKQKAEIDSKLAKFKETRYIKFNSGMMMFRTYDLESKSFPTFLNQPSQFLELDPKTFGSTFPVIELKFINANVILDKVYVPDEVTARKIETLRSSSDGDDLKLIFYGYVHGVSIEKFQRQNLFDSGTQEASKIVIKVQPIKYSFNEYKNKNPFGDVLAGPFNVN